MLEMLLRTGGASDGASCGHGQADGGAEAYSVAVSLLSRLLDVVSAAQSRGDFEWEDVVRGCVAQRALSASGAGAAEVERIAAGGCGRLCSAMGCAQQLSREASEMGFDWPDAESVWEKVEEERLEVLAELGRGKSMSTQALAEELGDLLFALVNFGRHLGLSTEEALWGANAKFTRRFGRMKEDVRRRGGVMGGLGMDALEDLWLRAKGVERRKDGEVS